MDINKYIEEVNAEIATIDSQIEVLKEEVKRVDPIRKQIIDLDEKKYHLQSVVSNLEILKSKDPEVQAVLHPDDPFGVDAD